MIGNGHLSKCAYKSRFDLTCGLSKSCLGTFMGTKCIRASFSTSSLCLTGSPANSFDYDKIPISSSSLVLGPIDSPKC